MTSSITPKASLPNAFATGIATQGGEIETTKTPELSVQQSKAPPSTHSPDTSRPTRVQATSQRTELSQESGDDDEVSLQSMGAIFGAFETAKNLANLGMAGINFNKSVAEGVITGAGAIRPAINKATHTKNVQSFDKKVDALTHAQRGSQAAPQGPSVQDATALSTAKANEAKARAEAIEASKKLLDTVPYAKGVNTTGVVTGLVGAANGMAASGASAAIAAAKLGLIEFGKKTSTLLPGVGIGAGAVSTGLSSKALWDNVKVHQGLSRQSKDIKAANNPNRPASTELKAALDNVAKHAGASIGRAQKLGRWDIADASLGVLTGALGTAASAMTSTGIGVVIGAPLSIATSAVGAVGKIGMTLGKFIQSKVLSKRMHKQSGAVDTPEKIHKELDNLRAKNKDMTEADARAKLASTNRSFALINFVEKLKSPASEADRKAAIAFLTDAKVPEKHLQALLLAVQSSDPITSKHSAVAYLHTLFGFQN